MFVELNGNYIDGVLDKLFILLLNPLVVIWTDLIRKERVILQSFLAMTICLVVSFVWLVRIGGLELGLGKVGHFLVGFL